MHNLLNNMPEWFQYPKEFILLYEEYGIKNLGLWFILEGEILEMTNEGLKNRYPRRNLVPFAKKTDSDDIACWDKEYQSKIVIIHDFASPGWEQEHVYESLYEWLENVFSDLVIELKISNSNYP